MLKPSHALLEPDIPLRDFIFESAHTGEVRATAHQSGMIAPPFWDDGARTHRDDATHTILSKGLLGIEWVIFRVLSAFSGIFLMIPGMIAVRLKGANPIQVQATTEVRLGCQFKSAGPAHVPLFPLSRWL